MSGQRLEEEGENKDRVKDRWRAREEERIHWKRTRSKEREKKNREREAGYLAGCNWSYGKREAMRSRGGHGVVGATVPAQLIDVRKLQVLLRANAQHSTNGTRGHQFIPKHSPTIATSIHHSNQAHRITHTPLPHIHASNPARTVHTMHTHTHTRAHITPTDTVPTHMYQI